jgi:transcriptional repressor NrdR
MPVRVLDRRPAVVLPEGCRRRGLPESFMRCPRCGTQNDKVIDSRSSSDGAQIRRRRQCLDCDTRFTTYEQVFHETMRVRKRSGDYQEFDRRKLRNGIERACEKRPVSAEQIETIVERIITELENEFGREVTSEQIGERVMKHLRKLDEVAYVRFASVYRQFHDAEQFIHEIQRMVKGSRAQRRRRRRRVVRS